MKTLFTIALALSMNFFAYASPENDQLAKNSGVSCRYQKVKITLLNGIGKVRISILDEKGMSLFTDFIKVKEDVVYPIDMANVPTGKYLIRISNKKESSEHWVDIKPKEITSPIIEAAVEVIDDQKLKVSVRGINEDLTLKMYNIDHRLLLKEDIKTRRSFSKRIKLQNLRPEHVYFTLTDEKGNQHYINR